MIILRKLPAFKTLHCTRNFSVSSPNNDTYSCKVLVVGGGSGGIAVAAKFSRRLKTKHAVILIEPSRDHYYQAHFTMVGAGIFKLRDVHKLEKKVIPRRVKWINDFATEIKPDCCCVETLQGHAIVYDYLVVAVGLVMNYAKTPGMLEGLQDPNSCVSTIFTPEHCEKTWYNIKTFKGGDALFTYPKSPVKCPGAPQKIAYLADSYFTKTNVRSKTNITYATCTQCIFGIKKYCDQLEKVAKRKKIKVELNMILKEIHPDRKEAVFHKCNCPEETETRGYDMLHVVPHQQAPDVVRLNTQIADEHGFLDVDKYTLQHKKYPNIYGIGDCMNTPNSKTGAAVAKQSYILEHNLLSTMSENCPSLKYNGYAACPLLTSYETVILAEFIYGGIPHETFPFDQSQESKFAFYMKKHVFPFVYWNLMLKGYYHGPAVARRILNPFGW